MRHRWVYVDGTAYEVGQEPVPEIHHVMPDIEPFQSPDGVYIQGRRHWREHLKATDSIEMGHSDVKVAQESWTKRKQAFRDRLKDSASTVAKLDRPVSEINRTDPTRLMVEMANRLHGRPTPKRKEMIKLTLDIAKRMKRG